eukprot:scaffold133911_cov36-Cyclotella_meneghiniana.AAC.1
MPLVIISGPDPGQMLEGKMFAFDGEALANEVEYDMAFVGDDVVQQCQVLMKSMEQLEREVVAMPMAVLWFDIGVILTAIIISEQLCLDQEFALELLEILH